MRPYNLNYTTKNVGSIKTFFADNNCNSYAKWGDRLRQKENNKDDSFEKKPPSMEEHKIRRERRDRIERHFHLK